jgi:hypothetical protein
VPQSAPSHVNLASVVGQLNAVDVYVSVAVTLSRAWPCEAPSVSVLLSARASTAPSTTAPIDNAKVARAIAAARRGGSTALPQPMALGFNRDA